MAGDGDIEERARREALTRAFLTFVLVPAWVVPAIADWAFHRATGIERNAGTSESLLHVAMSLEAGAGIVAGSVFEIDAGVIATTALAAIAHEATAVFDVAFAKPRRAVSQAEQHVHSFLEVLPFVNVALAAFARPRQAMALIGLGGGERPRFAWRVHRQIAPSAFLVCGASSVLGVGPYLEELVRCLRAQRRRDAG